MNDADTAFVWFACSATVVFALFIGAHYCRRWLRFTLLQVLPAIVTVACLAVVIPGLFGYEPAFQHVANLLAPLFCSVVLFMGTWVQRHEIFWED